MRQLAISMNLLIVLCLLSTCGASAREKTIKTAIVALRTARADVVKYDLVAQKAILDLSKTRAQFDVAIAAYRERRETVIAAFELAWSLVAAAATSDVSLDAMLRAISAAQASFDQLKAAETKP